MQSRSRRRSPKSLPPATKPPRSRSAAAVTALALLLAGCGVEDAQQEAAREEVQLHLGSLGSARSYDIDDVHCTDAAGIWFGEMETDVFTCAARLVEGGCDWFDVRVDRERRTVTVTLAQRDGGCTLGF